MFGSKDLLFTSEKYGVAKSLRFRSSASAYLNRTPASAGNRQKFTWSAWLKRGILGTQQFVFEAAPSTASRFFICLGNSATDELTVQITDTSAINGSIVTTQLFRDPSAWYHIVVAIDTTSTTNTLTGSSTDRMRLYVNGVQVSAFASTTVPTQNINTACNNTVTHALGSRATTLGNTTFDGYMAEVNLIDGQALTPSAFGFYDNNGIWQPKGYTGTYGTNGFYLKFTDVGATSGANSGYGKDFSGFNTNYWTTNNFGTTSTATTYDSMYDSPVNASNGITGIGNYPTLSPLQVTAASIGTASNGNLNWSATGTATYAKIYSTMALPTSGKWYWEVVAGATGNLEVGIISASDQTTYYPGYSSVGYVYYQNTGQKVNNNTFTAYGNSYTTNDVIGVAFDADNGALYFAKNNTWQNSGVPTSGASKTGAAFTNLTGTYVAALGNEASSASTSASINFGQQGFTYTPPSGFSALNTQNLPAPTISNGAANMAAVLYTGTSASNTVTATTTNSGNNPLPTTFQPDFVWIKSRSAATDHKLTDVVRGVTKALISDTTGAETTDTNGLTAFTTSGFTVGSDSNYNNGTGPATYVAWEWKAGGTGVSNTSGSITSTVSANASVGFSVVTYTGTGANATVGHGLGVAPSMIIVKNRSSGTDNWQVYHNALTSAAYRMRLNTTDAQDSVPTMWNSTAPTSTVFSVGSQTGSNGSSNLMVAYCFAPVSGYSAFGSYTGNGSTDGPFIYTGFRPRWIMLKRTDSTESWLVEDTSRDGYNCNSAWLYPNLSNAEDTSARLDILSNGFKLRNTTSGGNISTGTYIYAAIAENPFKISRAR